MVSETEKKASLAKHTPMSLTPAARNAEATHEATMEGAMNGLLTLIPCVGLVALAVKTRPGFALRTNWQSRTAMSIMPAMFVAALTGEQKLEHKMKEIAAETEHTHQTVKWAEEQMQLKQRQQEKEQGNDLGIAQVKFDSIGSNESNLRDLYLQSITQSDNNIRIVPGDSLAWYHRSANFISANPIKVLSAFSIPTIAWIFYGNTGKQNLDISQKLLHTRVFGQFATISCLLGVMGFSEFMNRNGRFMSQTDADERVAEMQQVRLQLIRRLELEHEHEEQMKREIELAHEEDLHGDNVVVHKKKHPKKVKKDPIPSAVEEADMHNTIPSANVA